MTREPAITAFDERRHQLLQDLLTFLRFPTISTLPERAGDLDTCARWVRGQLTDAGLTADIIPTAGHPVVCADSGPVAGRPDAPTLLFYGHYDVQPPGDLDLWHSPPFEPTIREGVIYARGSADDKGQVMTHLSALRCWHATGAPLPVRVKVLIEGEEEIGSPHLADFIREHRDRLACDYVVISDTSKHAADVPALTVATRGLVYKEISIEGPARDLHSGQYGGAVANPANVLTHLLASLHDGQHRVTIPGFYDDVLEFADPERRQLLDHGLTDADLLADTGSAAPCGEAGFATAERVTIRPTLDVNGLTAGFTGAGSATLIPAHARAKVSMRLVPHQQPERISEAFDRAIRDACPPTVRLRIDTQAACAAYVAPTDSPGVQAAWQALAQTWPHPPVLAREGGTLPILPLFKEVLGADSLLLGFSMPGCRIHSPDEFFGVRDFEDGTRCILRLIALMGAREM